MNNHEENCACVLCGEWSCKSPEEIDGVSYELKEEDMPNPFDEVLGG